MPSVLVAVKGTPKVREAPICPADIFLPLRGAESSADWLWRARAALSRAQCDYTNHSGLSIRERSTAMGVPESDLFASLRAAQLRSAVDKRRRRFDIDLRRGVVVRLQLKPKALGRTKRPPPESDPTLWHSKSSPRSSPTWRHWIEPPFATAFPGASLNSATRAHAKSLFAQMRRA